MKFGRIGGFPNQREFDSTSMLGRRPAWMAKPLSMDLRERAMSRVEAGGGVRAVAASLSISPSCVVKWSQRFRATGSVAPGKMGGHKPRILQGAHADWLRERISHSYLARARGRARRTWAEGGLSI